MLLYLVLLVLLVYAVQKQRRRWSLPPGPAPWPILGNVPALQHQDRWETKFIEWHNRYGPVITYWLGEKPFVSVATLDLMHKYFVRQGEVFAGRLNQPVSNQLIRGGHYGVIITSGALWKEHRRFALKVMRDFGLGKNQMEEKILVEVKTLLERVNRDICSDEIDFFNYTDIAVGSIINAIICGERFVGENEAEFYRVKELTTDVMKRFTDALANLVFNNPTLLKVPLLSRSAHEAIAIVHQIFAYLDTKIERHAQENDYGTALEPTDYIDAYLKEQWRLERAGLEHSFDRSQLRNVCLDLWLAGQETTSSTITWIVAYLIRYPHVQQLLHDELDKVIGSERIIKCEDRNELPYTNAVITECQRCCNLLAQNVPHSTTEDVEVEGHLLKKGTIILPQISVLMRDPVAFPNPHDFNPSRFIDESGRFKQLDEMIPFSLGKRVCLGEGLARMELFLLTANIFNHLRFEAGSVPPSLRKISGQATMTEPFKCRIQKRF